VQARRLVLQQRQLEGHAELLLRHVVAALLLVLLLLGGWELDYVVGVAGGAAHGGPQGPRGLLLLLLLGALPCGQQQLRVLDGLQVRGGVEPLLHAGAEVRRRGLQRPRVRLPRLCQLLLLLRLPRRLLLLLLPAGGRARPQLARLGAGARRGGEHRLLRLGRGGARLGDGAGRLQRLDVAGGAEACALDGAKRRLLGHAGAAAAWRDAQAAGAGLRRQALLHVLLQLLLEAGHAGAQAALERHLQSAAAAAAAPRQSAGRGARARDRRQPSARPAGAQARRPLTRSGPEACATKVSSPAGSTLV
jgi:hypothetical protein